MSGLGPGGLLSRRPSYQVGHAGDLASGPSRQSSIMSMVSGWWLVVAQHVGSNVTVQCNWVQAAH